MATGIYRQIEVDSHEMVAFFSDPSVGLRCIIAIHDTTLGPALGGTRMWPYASEEQAVQDALRLSEAMTYKASLAGLDLGGGKGVILGDPYTQKTEGLLRAYGRAVQTLGGRYITAEDVGTTAEDLEIVMQETNWITGKPLAVGGSGDSAVPTGYGVYQAALACAEVVFGEASLKGRTIALQGFGKVAAVLARYLVDEGASLIVAEIDSMAQARARDGFGASIVSPEEIYDVDCDIFAPCALGGVLNEGTISRLKCAIVCGSANNQLACPDDGDLFEGVGILYAPDYLVNAGGLINLSFELTGYDGEAAMTTVAAIRNSMARIISLARDHGVSTSAMADKLASNRIQEGRRPR